MSWRESFERSRAEDDMAGALLLLDSALAAQPNGPELLLLKAQLMLDAGLPAVDLFAAAARADPSHGAAQLGLAAALLAEHRGDLAESVIAQSVDHDAAWVEGQVYLAKLRWRQGDADFTRDFDAALTRQPQVMALWLHRIALDMQAGRHGAALALVDRAEAALGAGAVWLAHRAACLDELGDHAGAAQLFAKLGSPQDAGVALRLIRHKLRIGEPTAVEPAAQPWLSTPAANTLWPYIALAWRLLDDPRYAWLEGNPALIGIYDLGPQLGDLAQMAVLLRKLHGTIQQPIDQSLRGGTQTDGYLLARSEPEFRALRTVLAETVAQHIAALGPRDPFHPILKHRRDQPVAFSGAWSVRLDGGGRHVSHVHPLGWFSSALYIALPDAQPGEPKAGWFEAGRAEDELGLHLDPMLQIEPKPGRLVLFPSTLWHGTRAFGAGERLTIAFDVAQPK